MLPSIWIHSTTEVEFELEPELDAIPKLIVSRFNIKLQVEYIVLCLSFWFRNSRSQI